MRDADIPGEFSLSNRDVLADPRWWGGEPIWNTAEKQGRKAGAMFWPGSETVIGGRQATYWTPFDDDMPNSERVKRVLGWLKLPESEAAVVSHAVFQRRGQRRPQPRTGLRRGEERRHAASTTQIGDLVNGVKDAGLADRVHYVIVSDHGMAALSTDRMIVLDDYIDVDTADVVDWAPVLALTPKDGDVEKLYAALKDKHPALGGLSRAARSRPSTGSPGIRDCPPWLAIAKEGWYITSKRDVARWGEPDRRAPGGDARLRRARANRCTACSSPTDRGSGAA